METVMNGIEKYADYYRGYLPHRRSLIPLTIALATTVALWLSLYLISDAGPTLKPETAVRAMHATSIVSGQWTR
jgi:ABC-type transport system involved in cytochrome bd biosynthesis fused ATPase/permease subunit